MKQETLNKTLLYSIFHLNLAYSSIAEKDIPQVVKRCYWPLLSLAEKFPKAVSIEASGYTIEKIQRVDNEWVEKLRKLIKDGICEFVGSGYSQIIGTLVPAEINEKNLWFGNEIYRKHLGITPKVAYVNEQAYGAGLLSHYKKIGYLAIIMEWNNPASFHPEWNNKMSYYPQIAVNQQGETLPIIWNNSTHFQRFQRFVYDEIDEKQYFSYLVPHLANGRYICLYGSDTEVFDFRPGRFHSEKTLGKTNEYKRICSLFQKLSNEKKLKFVLPSEVLQCKPNGYAFRKVHLESAVDPLPVKKQEKYNIGRWGLTGRKTLEKNSNCYKLYYFIKNQPGTSSKSWKELCYFWSSDFRTHIEKGREKLYLSRLMKRVAQIPKINSQKSSEKFIKPVSFTNYNIDIKEDGGHIIIKSKTLNIVLDSKKGLSIESVTFNKISSIPLIITLPQGYYEDNEFNADFFSGHAIIDIPGVKRITDLSPVRPIYKVIASKDETGIKIMSTVPFGEGTVTKTITLLFNLAKVRIDYFFSPNIPSVCSFRAGFLTFNPEVFDMKRLFYACHNGGYNQDVFSFGKDPLKVAPVSLLVSTRRALGNTTGVIEIGDINKKVTITTDMQDYATLPMIQFERMLRSPSFFLRSKFSLQEFDDTTSQNQTISKKPIHFALTIEAYKK